MKVTSEIENYDDPAKTSVRVHSHWSDKRKVVLEFVGGESRTVWADDLVSAIKNAQNSGTR